MIELELKLGLIAVKLMDNPCNSHVSLLACVHVSHAHLNVCEKKVWPDKNLNVGSFVISELLDQFFNQGLQHVCTFDNIFRIFLC